MDATERMARALFNAASPQHNWDANPPAGSSLEHYMSMALAAIEEANLAMRDNREDWLLVRRSHLRAFKDACLGDRTDAAFRATEMLIDAIEADEKAKRQL